MLMATWLMIISRARVAMKKLMTIFARSGPKIFWTGCVLPNKINQNDDRKGASLNWQRLIRKVI